MAQLLVWTPNKVWWDCGLVDVGGEDVRQWWNFEQHQQLSGSGLCEAGY